MGERKGQNFYYPPDFNPAKHGSLNGYHGTHALRERGKKASEGILTIRFEMPFNCWCLTCNKPIGMGVRYNAEKKKVDMYYTTPIYQFLMRCHLCAGDILMQTDPKNFDYIILHGARRKEQRWDPKENEQVYADERETKKKLALDAMFKLEHGVEDKGKSDKALPGLSEIEDRQSGMKDDFLLNQMARKTLREAKKSEKLAEERDSAFLEKTSLLGSGIFLVQESEKDKKIASLLKYTTNKTSNQRRSESIIEMERQSIFSPNTVPAGSSSSSSGSGALLRSPTNGMKVQHLKKLARNISREKATKHGPDALFSVVNPPGGKKPRLDEERRAWGLGMPKKGAVDPALAVEEGSGSLAGLIGYEDSDQDSDNSLSQVAKGAE